MKAFRSLKYYKQLIIWFQYIFSDWKKKKNQYLFDSLSSLIRQLIFQTLNQNWSKLCIDDQECFTRLNCVFFNFICDYINHFFSFVYIRLIIPQHYIYSSNIFNEQFFFSSVLSIPHGKVFIRINVETLLTFPLLNSILLTFIIGTSCLLLYCD